MARETVFSSIPDMEEEEVERNEYSKGILRRGHLYFTSYRWGGKVRHIITGKGVEYDKNLMYDNDKGGGI